MQLALLAWKTVGISGLASGSMPEHLLLVVARNQLGDDERLTQLRALREGKTCCPLCLEPITAQDLMTRVEQAEGREVVDLTITEGNLFHLEDLRPGKFTHASYKVGWGHHYCNQVSADRGIDATLAWMAKVLKNSGQLE